MDATRWYRDVKFTSNTSCLRIKKKTVNEQKWHVTHYIIEDVFQSLLTPYELKGLYIETF